MANKKAQKGPSRTNKATSPKKKPKGKPIPGLGRPLFTSYIYTFKPDGGLAVGGGGGGHAAIGGSGAKPRFVVHTYPYVPPKAK